MAQTQSDPSAARAPRCRWSLEETNALVEARAPLHQRRRQAQGDPWVPSHQRSRTRSSLDLVDEDWRALAVAVNNDNRAPAGLRSNRTGEQCKSRMKYLKTRYRRELISKKKPSRWQFFTVLDPVLAGAASRRRSTRATPLKVEQQAQKEVVLVRSGAVEEERGGDGEAAGGTRAGRRSAGGTDGNRTPRILHPMGAGSTRAVRRSAGGSVAAVVNRLSDMYERVVMKRLDIDAAERARDTAGTRSGRR